MAWLWQNRGGSQKWEHRVWTPSRPAKFKNDFQRTELYIVPIGNMIRDNLQQKNNEKSFCENLTKALRNYNLSVKKADMAYKNLDLYSKHNTLDKLNNVLKKVN